MRPVHRVFLAVAVLSVVAPGCSHKAKANAGTTTTSAPTSSTSTSSTTTSTTSTVAPAPTTASTTTTSTSPPRSSTTSTTVAPATTSSTTTTSTSSLSTTAAPPTTIRVVTGATSPGRAAAGLIAGWQTGDRAAAAGFADPAAVRAMFQITTEPVRAAGPCQPDGTEFACAYFTKSGNTFFLRVKGARATGYRVIEVTTAND